ncbi:hypothetical protein [Haloarcula amylovorans]|uniref:hypothetical protein n=1 Tax=Haloarcula amylovorans TaxID=2562280 RepID=UPI001075E16F|nr:hypothetical protein [Halomicroarcula amylolytica]
MVSENTTLFRSIRRWLLVVAFSLGIGIVVLADTGYMLSGYQDGPIFAAAGIAGGIVALVAGLRLLGSVWRVVFDGSKSQRDSV